MSADDPNNDDAKLIELIDREIEAAGATNPSGMSASRHWAIVMGKSTPTETEQRLLADPNSRAFKHHRQVLKSIRDEMSSPLLSKRTGSEAASVSSTWIFQFVEALRAFVQLHTGRALIVGGHLGQGKPPADIVRLSRPRGLPFVRLSKSGVVWEPIFEEQFDPSKNVVSVHRLHGSGAIPTVANGSLLLEPENPGISAFAVTYADAGRFVISETRIVVVESAAAENQPTGGSLERWMDAHKSLAGTNEDMVGARLLLLDEIIRILAQSIGRASEVDRTLLGPLPGGRMPSNLDPSDWDEITVQPLLVNVLTPLLDWVQSQVSIRPD